MTETGAQIKTFFLKPRTFYIQTRQVWTFRISNIDYAALTYKIQILEVEIAFGFWHNMDFEHLVIGASLYFS